MTMSQPCPSSESTTEDRFLPSPDQDQLSQADFQELFGLGTPEEDVFSPSTSEGFSGIGFAYEDVSLVSVDSVRSSNTSTPDFSSFSFRQHSPAYATPELDKPRPCPFETQKAYETSAPQRVLSRRPRHVRQHTNDVRLHAAQLPQHGLRRRSLSHSDVDRIAGSARMPNPTFVRLQAPRFRVTIPEELWRGELGTHCGRSSCQFRDRSTEPASIPYSLHPNALVYGMLPTPIGTPLNEVEDTDSDVNTLHRHYNITTPGLDVPLFSRDPIFRQISRPEELARSQQIIEIGALAVTNHEKVDPRLETCHSIPHRELVLKKLADIEEHVKKAGGIEALRSCRTIRNVLTGKTESENETDAADGVLSDGIDPSKNTTAKTYADYF